MSDAKTGLAHVVSLVRDVPDFPRPGILFKDLTPVLADPRAFATCIALVSEPWRGAGVEVVVGIESRGFIFGAAVAHALGVGFVPARKPGKLPSKTIRADYALEYGSDSLELHVDSVRPGARALIVDDLIATGGTARAACELVRRLGGVVVGAAFVVELAFLSGAARLDGVTTTAILRV